LRGEDSEKDQQFVEQVCEKYGVPCHVERIDLQKVLDTHGGNLQETARTVRYRYFENFKVKKNNRIALAHHADDQIETFFLNLARGSGVLGLAGMLAKHEQYVRPLLAFTKREIKSYALENGVEWREDRSNAENKYNRNKLRNIFIPEMVKEVPSLRESVLTLVRAFQETQQQIEARVEPLRKDMLETRLLSITDFDGLTDPELNELLRQLDLPSGIGGELIKLRTSQVGKVIELPNSLFIRIVHEKEGFYFMEQTELPALPEIQMEIVEELPSTFDKQVLYLNPEKITGKLAVRYWKIGDRIKPVGLKGSKLISDVLTDAGIPSHERHNQLVLCDDEKILWCIGYSVSREAVAAHDSVKMKITLAVR
jgi:tRNA(Ile)-lysidine synthase